MFKDDTLDIGHLDKSDAVTLDLLLKKYSKNSENNRKRRAVQKQFRLADSNCDGQISYEGICQCLFHKSNNTIISG